MWHLPLRELPEREPGTAPTERPIALLMNTARRQRGLLTLNAIFGVIWMVCQALTWTAVGEAVDAGVITHSVPALWRWAGVAFGLALVQALAGALRHQLAVTNWMTASFRTMQVLGRHIAVVGPALTDEIPSGDVVNTATNDAARLGGAYDVFARFVGAIASWVTVSVIMLSTSRELGLVVLIGTPLLAALTTPLMRPLHHSQARQREEGGRLAAIASDTVAGLRILRGVGGEDVFFRNYQDQSDRFRVTGNKVAGPQAGLDSGQVLLPALLTAAIAYMGAHLVLEHRLEPGQLVSFFGYSTFLTTPLRTGIEYIIATTRAFVAANKVQRVLRVTPDIADEGTAAWPAQWQRVIDATSGLTLSRGHLVGLVTESPDEAVEIADRIGRFSHAADVTIDDVAATSIRLSDYRRHLVVSEIEPRLFAGTLRHEMTLRDTPDDERLLAALTTTSATDIVDGLDGGLDAWIEERGRGLSGGQRQRLALTRALLTDAEIVVLVEPTSAVDAHTERRIARALPLARAGRTTLVTTSSPIMLEQCDRVVVVRDGRVVASGTHDELCRDAATYRHIVLREDL